MRITNPVGDLLSRLRGKPTNAQIDEVLAELEAGCPNEINAPMRASLRRTVVAAGERIALAREVGESGRARDIASEVDAGVLDVIGQWQKPANDDPDNTPRALADRVTRRG